VLERRKPLTRAFAGSARIWTFRDSERLSSLRRADDRRDRQQDHRNQGANGNKPFRCDINLGRCFDPARPQVNPRSVFAQFGICPTWSRDTLLLHPVLLEGKDLLQANVPKWLWQRERSKRLLLPASANRRLCLLHDLQHICCGESLNETTVRVATPRQIAVLRLEGGNTNDT
jgi:hypothetical protein